MPKKRKNQNQEKSLRVREEKKLKKNLQKEEKF